MNLVAPVSCAGCHRPDVTLCRRCAEAIEGPVREPSVAVARALYRVPIVSAGAYRGVRRSVVLELKDRGRWKLASALVSVGLLDRVRSACAGAPRAVVVPVPPSRNGAWRRGYAPTSLVAKALAGRIRGLQVHDAVHAVHSLPHWRTFRPRVMSPFVRAKRSRSQRLGRTSAAFWVGVLPPGCQVILVDDVMATGATLEAVARALQIRGHVVVLAVVLAHVPQPTKVLISSIGNRRYAEPINLTRRT